MKISKFILALTLLTTTEAFSQGYNSARKNKNVRLSYVGHYTEVLPEPVIFAHPREGETLLSAGYTWQKVEQEMSTVLGYPNGYNGGTIPAKLESEISTARMNAEFGIIGGFFGGIEMTYSDSKSKLEIMNNEPRASDKGFQDPKLTAGYSFRMDQWKFIGTLGYQIKAQDRVVDAEDNGNGKEGASYFQPGFVAVYNFDHLLIGGEVQGIIRSERTTRYALTSTTSKQTGGNTYTGTAFMEFPGKIQPGVALSYVRYDKKGTEENGSLSENGASSVGMVSVYSQFKVAKNFHVIPRAGYATMLTYEATSLGAKTNNADFQHVGVEARLGF